MEVEAYKLAFGIGATLCAISAMLLASIQLRKASKHGVYSSVLKNLTTNEIRNAKISGIIFLGGVIIIILGFVLRDAL